MKPSSAALSLLIVMVVAAACGVASPPAAIDTATPPATRTPTSLPSPTLTSTPDALSEASATAPLRISALPVCRQPSQIDLGELTLAFIADWDGDQDVYLVQADGSGVVQITDNATIDRAPRWSPDGQKLAYIDDLTRRPRLIVSNADGSNASMVPFDREVFFDLVWSTTAQQIVLLSGSELIAVDLDTGEAVNLTGGARYELELPSFSPDGGRIVFAAAVPVTGGWAEDRLFTVKVDGTGLTELSVPTGYPRWPTWSPQGDEILFEGVAQSGMVGLYVARLDGSIRRLDANPKETGSLPSWSPDGTMIAYVEGDSKSGASGRPMDALHVATVNEGVDETVLT
ncbi:MAG: hypothetical protein ACC700_10345, partial [Anaerolineales bacterium]